MLAEIKNRYKGFSDAVVTEVIYNASCLKSATVYVRALNWKTNHWEKVKLSFLDVVKFRFFESEKINSTVVFEAYIDKIKDVVVFDFFASQLSQNEIGEDPNSDYVIHCKEIEYELIEVLSS